MLEDRIDQDTKTAMLGGDKQKVSVLRGLKAVMLNLKVASGKRESGLSDTEVEAVLSKQSKQRQESADIYRQAGDEDRSTAELQEKDIIDAYLPKKLTDEQINKLIDEVIARVGSSDASSMGPVIGQVKAKAGASADGGDIARLVRAKLT